MASSLCRLSPDEPSSDPSSREVALEDPLVERLDLGRLASRAAQLWSDAGRAGKSLRGMASPR